jgi:hypothetical protein
LKSPAKLKSDPYDDHQNSGKQSPAGKAVNRPAVVFRTYDKKAVVAAKMNYPRKKQQDDLPMPANLLL